MQVLRLRDIDWLQKRGQASKNRFRALHSFAPKPGLVYIHVFLNRAHEDLPRFACRAYTTAIRHNSESIMESALPSIKTVAPPPFATWETLSTTLNKIPKSVAYLPCQPELFDVLFSYTSLYPSYCIVFDATSHLQHGELLR
jgi:hypothetical protein